MRLKPLSTGLLISGCFASLGWSYTLPESTEAYLSPKVDVAGHVERVQGQYEGQYAGSGSVQALIPILQFKMDSTDLWYGYARGDYKISKDREFLGAAVSIGTGYRWQLDSEWQVGGYVLAEARRYAESWFITGTPGIEVSTAQWRLNLNGYMPISRSNPDLNNAAPRDKNIAPMGIELNGTWRFDEQLSLSLGGYYLQYKGKIDSTDISEARPGVRVGFGYAPVPNVRIEVQGQYDKEETGFSVQFSTNLLGGQENTGTLTDPLYVSPTPKIKRFLASSVARGNQGATISEEDSSDYLMLPSEDNQSAPVSEGRKWFSWGGKN